MSGLPTDFWDDLVTVHEILMSFYSSIYYTMNNHLDSNKQATVTPNSPSRAYQGWFLTLYIYSFRLESLQQSFPAWKICLYEDLLSVQDSEMLTCRVQLEWNIWEQTYPVISWNQRTEQNASDSCQTVDIREWKPLIPDRNKWGGFSWCPFMAFKVTAQGHSEGTWGREWDHTLTL